MMTGDPQRWPEVIAGKRSAIVCDGCHASLAQLAATGHHPGCDTNGRHQHHVAQPVQECGYYLEWANRGHPPDCGCDGWRNRLAESVERQARQRSERAQMAERRRHGVESRNARRLAAARRRGQQ